MSTLSPTETIGMKEVKSLLPIPVGGAGLYQMSGSGVFPPVYSRPIGSTETQWVRSDVLLYLDMVCAGASHEELEEFVSNLTHGHSPQREI